MTACSRSLVGCPIASSRVQPNSCSAASFQKITRNAASVAQMASCTLASRCACRESAASVSLRASMSVNMARSPAGSPASSSTGLLLTRTHLRAPLRSLSRTS